MRRQWQCGGVSRGGSPKQVEVTILSTPSCSVAWKVDLVPRVLVATLENALIPQARECGTSRGKGNTTAGTE